MHHLSRPIRVMHFMLVLAILACGGMAAEAATLAVEADSYIQGTPTSINTNFGTASVVQIKYNDSADFNRKGYFRFNAGGPQDYASASLSFTVAPFAANSTGTPWTFSVYGLLDGNAGNNWIESGAGSITWTNAPANVAAGNAVNLAQVFNGAALATFNLTGGGVAGSTVTLDSATFPDLLDFLNADTDGLMTFIMLRNTQAPLNNSANNIVHQFVSREANANATLLNFELVAVVPEAQSLYLWSVIGVAFCASLGCLARRKRPNYQ